MTDLIFREIANGMWFLANVAYFTLMAHYLVSLKIYGRFDYDDRATRLAIAMLVYLSAALIRSGYIWILLLAENAELGIDPVLRSISPIMFASAFVGIAGVLCAVRVMSDKTWRARVWIQAGLIAVFAPIVVHFAINEDSREYIRMVLTWWWTTGSFDP